MLTITGFVAQDNQIFAAVRFIGRGIDIRGEVCMGALQGMLLPVRIRRTSPDVLKLEFGPLSLDMLEARAELGKATVNITAYPDPSGSRRALLGAISELLKEPASSPERQVRFLNYLLIELP